MVSDVPMKYFIYVSIFFKYYIGQKYIEMFRVSKQLFYAISDMMICNVMLCYQSSNSLISISILCLYCTIWYNTQLQTLPLITILKIMTILIVKQILYQ